MKHLHATLPRHCAPWIFAAACSAAFLLAAAMPASAQTTKTTKGDFRSSDGDSGTFVKTVTVSGETSTTKTVLTRTSDSATSTDITVTTKNADKSENISYSHTDFGATAAFTSNRTSAKIKGGRTATGTYTNAIGVTGTLTTIETNVGDASILSTEYVSSTNLITRDLRAEEVILDEAIVKEFTLDSNGNSGSTVTTFFVTSANG